jgi:hypothetical protein
MLLRLCLLGLCSLMMPLAGRANCLVQDSKGQPASPKGDFLYRFLSQQKNCPQNVLELKALLLADGLRVRPAMVANRGFHNSSQGSFSFFERGVGESRSLGMKLGNADFYFGHFTQAEGQELALAQSEGLMIELILWDFDKGTYNFYELIGTGEKRQWFYRGDSFDIFEDNRLLHLQKDPSRPVFGQRLRCSGCHASGGPIMKELQEPHNDWWRGERALPLFGLKPQAEVVSILNELDDAAVLAAAVREGIDRLERDPRIRAVKSGKSSLPSGRRYSFREALRPLFATVEINLESDSATADKMGDTIQIPAASRRDPRLALAPLQLPRGLYDAELDRRNLHFPETDRRDADHAWLTPVKSYSDRVAIDVLIEEGWVSEKFVLAVLAIDADQPLFSPMRMSLLKFVALESANGQELFIAEMKRVAREGSTLEQAGAKSFLGNWEKSSEALRQESAQAMRALQAHVSTGAGVSESVDRLIKDRRSVLESEISKNPRGQILEPGFRVIFPEPPSRIAAADCNESLKE